MKSIDLSTLEKENHPIFGTDWHSLISKQAWLQHCCRLKQWGTSRPDFPARFNRTHFLLSAEEEFMPPSHQTANPYRSIFMTPASFPGSLPPCCSFLVDIPAWNTSFWVGRHNCVEKQNKLLTAGASQLATCAATDFQQKKHDILFVHSDSLCPFQIVPMMFWFLCFICNHVHGFPEPLPRGNCMCCDACREKDTLLDPTWGGKCFK